MSRFASGRCSVAIAVVFGGAALGGCAGVPAGSLVAAPAADAEPAQVVQAVVDAVNDRDAELVAEITTSGFLDSLERTWLAHGYLTEATIGATVDDAGTGTAYDEANTAAVNLTFTPEQADSSMTNGEPVTWAVLLVEQGGRWVVFDMGAG
ncbi:hypothetical protein [Cellulosimicrobium sp. Marseille-Q8652]